LIITVTHYPPGASKWNPIDHRMFSLISAHWSGAPLVSYETILGYIRRTRSSGGFHCEKKARFRWMASSLLSLNSHVVWNSTPHLL